MNSITVKLYSLMFIFSCSYNLSCNLILCILCCMFYKYFINIISCMKHATRNNHNMSFINKKLLLIIINNKLNIKCLIQLLTSYDKKKHQLTTACTSFSAANLPSPNHD